MRFTRIHSLITAVMLTSICGLSATAGTKVLTFDWEDGTSTVLDQFISGTEAMATYSNVTEGSEFDYGADPPAQYDVSPSQGSRMLEVSIDPVDEFDSDAVNPFLAYVEHLDDGDLIQFSFQAYDPSDGRSPSVLVSGTYGTNNDLNSFSGFFTPFQEFPPGTGWLDVVLDNAADGVNFPVDPNVPFEAGDQGDREAVIMRARPFRPSSSTLGNGGSGSYKFFIDDLRISVTSQNPLAQITLPDGSVTLVNGVDTVPGDYNNSGLVEQADLDLVLLNWGGLWPPEIAGWVNDQPADGVIDQNDLDGVLLNWGNTAAAASVVPEPSALLLCVVGLLVYCGKRK